MYTIGQLSKKTSVTVRTLDYYDEIGLLKAISKTDGGHRLYTDEDVMQLQRILALKYMGFSLEKIKLVLEESKQTWQDSLKQQLEMVRQEQMRLKILEQALVGVSYSIEIEGHIDWQMIFDIIHLFQNPETAMESYESYLNEEQIKSLFQLNEQLSEAEIKKWISSIDDIKNNLDLNPKSDNARILVENWMKQAESMLGNDEELLGDLADALRNMQDGIVFYPMTKEVIHFIESVVNIHSLHEE
ncbi:MerR family transcriptional regulator [Oceanobacillus zhaokaii]|uniref:MerR family transcriptional regulator n=1 Tax=Oceanobacillus zhaokaii TaxID=2052660 RepID=A0A345PIV1_9BACI|nr:MerR family transcriptional regulator [Oceanobacillus zhaokaii]AXI09931.1 MerR family transcriptional regulator [Oceanobacillus zhaokaii]